MSAIEPQVNRPASQRRTLPPRQTFFVVFGGPLAWFLQLNASYALASNPCFFQNERVIAPQLAHDWSGRVMIVIAVAAFAVALAATFTAWRAYRRTKAENSGDRRLDTGAGRSRFLALWGTCLGSGSALFIIVTAAAFFVLPRCAG
jgi:hypothetical protein